jgi:hypothetical protein
MTPAQRAANTRRNRKNFRESYPDTCNIAEDILTDNGMTTEDIADQNFTTIQSVAAVKANLTRWGTYGDMAYDCNF